VPVVEEVLRRPRKRGGGGVLDDPRLRPHRWIMLDTNALYCRRRSFLNVSTGQCIQVDIPELVDHRVLRSTAAEGLLFLQHGYRPIIGLLNPPTRQAGELPPLGNLQDKYGHTASLAAGKAGLADDRMVWLRFSRSAMAFAKPGDERWVVLDLDNDVRGYMLTPTVFFAGRFYGVTTHAIVTVDMNETNRDGGLPPRMVEAAKLDNVGIGGLYDDSAVNLLVDNNAGKLMLVHRMFHRDRTYGYRRIYKVYQVDLEAGKVTTRGDVGLAQPRRRTPCPLGVSSGVPLHRRQHRLPGPHHV
jgi:hypothetical protein